MKRHLLPLAAALACWVLSPAQAASVFLSPASQTVDLAAGTASFELMMDFSAAEAMIGGGVDIDLTGPITLAGFTPSAYYTATFVDPAFSGFGTAAADNDLEVHFGLASGQSSGQNSLGTVRLNLLGAGTGGLAMALNSTFGEFVSASTGEAMPVTLTGAAITITAVPEPTALALWLTGLLALGVLVRRGGA